MTATRALPSRAAGLWAAAAPLLCAVHCVAAPLLVLAVPALGHGAVETAFRAATLLLAAAFLRAGLRAHGRPAVLLPALLGLAAWVLAGAWHDAEAALGPAGGLLLAAAMLWSARLRHRALCHACGCPAHAHDD